MFSKINYRLLINALSFQVTWFICVQGNNLHAVLATSILLAVHLFIFKVNVIQHIKTGLLLFVFCLIGFLGDNLIASAVYLSYSSPDFVPVWLLCLWIAFSITMNHSMKWLFKNPAISFFTGLLLVPLSYFAGITLSGSTLLSPYWQFFILEGLWWAVVLTVYQKLSTISGLSQQEETNHV